MKKLLTFMLCICTASMSYAQSNMYFHPFQQTDSVWTKFSSAHERIRALQIPQDMLANITTADLLDVCLTFPYLSDILLYESEDRGYTVLVNEYNGFQEFLKRTDCVDALLDKYASILSDTVSQNEMSKIEKGFRSVQYYTAIQMLKMKYNSDDMNDFQVEKLFSLTKELCKSLDAKQLYIGNLTSNAIKQINTFITRIVYHTDFNWVYRYTPNGSNVSVGILDIADYNENEKEYLKFQVINNFGATFISEATKSYNCHGYAWHMIERYEDDPVWIDEEDIYWQDSSYTEVPEDYATKVAYEGNHSAVRISSTLYHSKWGELPLVAHSPNNVPSGYLPNQPKRYFVKFSIVGPTIPETISTYYVPNLPNGWTVTWSMENELILPNYIIVNYPEINQLQINNTSHNHINGNLVAKIFNENNTLMKTVTKHINTAEGFSATYSQTTLPDMNQISGTINDGGSITNATQGSPLTLVSNDFYGATFTFNTTTIPTLIPNPINPGIGLTSTINLNPTYTLSGNTVELNFPYNSSDLNSIVKCVKGNKVINFTVIAKSPYTGGLSPFSLQLSTDNNILDISVINTAEDSQTSYIKQQNEYEEWDLSIYNAQTYQIVYSGKLNEGKSNIDISRWNIGIYIVQVKSGDYTLAQKIKL